MSQVLYRKYRSKGFAEVVGQEHITRTLENAIKKGMVSHAYLFTGPRGVGKTSVARILAHTVNQLPYSGDDTTHLDIIEIDAASNRRIDEIRNLRDKIHIAPAIAKYKVYIVDEVHMLTTEAFNALLKTLEEPPAHAIFILATTEAHKVPETIISRTQRFSFKPIESEDIIGHLKQVAASEKIDIKEDALRLIAQHASGSFRDALSLLDQVRSLSAELDSQAVETVLGLPPQGLIEELLSFWERGQLSEVFRLVESLQEQGISSALIARAISRTVRDGLVESPVKIQLLLPLIEKLLEVESSVDPTLQLETALAASMPTALTTPADLSPAVTQENLSSHAQKPPKSKQPTTADVVRPKDTTKNSNKPEVASTKQPARTAKPAKKIDFDWVNILAATKQANEPLYSLLRMALADFDNKEGLLTLRFRFAFHVKRLESEKQINALREVLDSNLSSVPEISIVHDSSIEVDQAEKHLKKVADVLGGEVIEL